MTDFRKNPTYVALYVFWAKFLLVEMIPYFNIIVLNGWILVKIHKSSSFQRKFRRSTGGPAPAEEGVALNGRANVKENGDGDDDESEEEDDDIKRVSSEG